MIFKRLYRRWLCHRHGHKWGEWVSLQITHRAAFARICGRCLKIELKGKRP